MTPLPLTPQAALAQACAHSRFLERLLEARPALIETLHGTISAPMLRAEMEACLGQGPHVAPLQSGGE